MVLLTYDEHGGYYDHVAPVAVPNPDGIHPNTSNTFGDDFTYTGIRVPTVIISPWAKANHVSHTVYDHTSLSAFLEAKYQIPPMTQRDAAANNMLDLFDFSQRSFATPPELPLPPALEQTVACIQNGQNPLHIPTGL
jgi:phospholipase C